MDSDGLRDVLFSKDEQIEHSETTVEIKIKTLDSQTYTLRVDKFLPVPALKEQIATVTGILSEQQRLICRGKVLKDDQLLSAYHVEDGHTLHLVVRQPSQHPFSSTADLMRGSGSSTDAPASDVPNNQERSGQVAHSVVLGTFNIGDEGDGQLPNINRIVSAVLGSIGIGSTGTGTEIIDLREQDAERRSRNSAGSASPVITGLHPEQSTSRGFLEPVHGVLRPPPAGLIQPTVIPDSLTTLSLYLTQMRQEFITNGIHGSESQEPGSGIDSDSRRGGLPTPELLADVMLSSRAMLVEQAGELLSELARQLGDQCNVIDPSARIALQSNAMRTGAMLRNLGALLLELGRTTMTLRMGTTPSEAVVNAGPAVFISTSGPNPIMAQPLPFQSGTSFGGHVMASGTLGSGIIPRNIDIRIRTGSNSMPSSSANVPGEPNRAQLPPGQSDPSRSSSVTVPGIVTGASLGGESGVRIVPIRTVVAAVPTSVARPPPFDTTGGALGIFYPLGRFQQLQSGNLGTQGVPFGDSTSSASQTDRQIADGSSMQQRSSATLRESSAGGILPTLNGPSTHLVSPNSGLIPSTSSVTHQGLSPNNNPEQQSEGNTRNSSVNRNNGTQGDHEEHNAEEPFRNIRNRFDEFLQTLFQGEHMNSNITTSTNNINNSNNNNNNNNNDNDGDNNVEGSSSMHLSEQTELTVDNESQNETSTEFFFSDLIRQLMPFISQRQTVSTEQIDPSSINFDTEHEGRNSLEQTEGNDSHSRGTSHHRDNSSMTQEAKRQKRE